jgi:signal transduction histidine kinase
MTMRILDNLTARLVLVSMLGITLVHVASLYTYERALDDELAQAGDRQLAERIVAIKQAVMAVPPQQREGLAHDLSSGPVEAHWNPKRGAAPGGDVGAEWQSLPARLRDLAIDLQPSDIVLGAGADPHMALLSIRFPDDSWLNVNLFTTRVQHSRHGTLASTTLMALGVALLSLLLARSLTRPLRRMADVVTTLRADDVETRVPEDGPREVRELAVAFNGLRKRLGDLVTRRTRSLAAVSHDLRTPLTRLRLRLAEVPNGDLQHAMAADIDEMEQMIQATLSYLKGEETSEPKRQIDLVALVETIVDHARDQGHDATLSAPARVVVDGRLLGLKRAFGNLVGNALRFGSKVAVSVEALDGAAIVRIADDGPGIPEDKLDAVLEPFVRLEESRNTETGGVGLGLTIASSIVEGHGGMLRLSNRTEGGLQAEVRLPLSAALRGSTPL